jgi:hypothetical protein
MSADIIHRTPLRACIIEATRAGNPPRVIWSGQRSYTRRLITEVMLRGLGLFLGACGEISDRPRGRISRQHKEATAINTKTRVIWASSLHTCKFGGTQDMLNDYGFPILTTLESAVPPTGLGTTQRKRPPLSVAGSWDLSPSRGNETRWRKSRVPYEVVTRPQAYHSKISEAGLHQLHRTHPPLLGAEGQAKEDKPLNKKVWTAYSKVNCPVTTAMENRTE